MKSWRVWPLLVLPGCCLGLLQRRLVPALADGLFQGLEAECGWADPHAEVQEGQSDQKCEDAGGERPQYDPAFVAALQYSALNGGHSGRSRGIPVAVIVVTSVVHATIPGGSPTAVREAEGKTQGAILSYFQEDIYKSKVKLGMSRSDLLTLHTGRYWSNNNLLYHISRLLPFIISLKFS